VAHHVDAPSRKILKCVIGEITRGKGEENERARLRCGYLVRSASCVKIPHRSSARDVHSQFPGENFLGRIWRNKMNSTALSAPEHDRADVVASSKERSPLKFFLAFAIAAFLAATAVSAALAQDAYGGITGSNYPDPYHHQGQYAR
jgi:hypothetical protein